MSYIKQHYPVPASTKTIDGVDKQRIYDQRVMQDNITSAFNDLIKPQINSILLENIELTTEEVLVEHLLGKKVRGWKITSKSANANIWDSIKSTNVDLTKYLPLTASAVVTVDIEVF